MKTIVIGDIHGDVFGLMAILVLVGCPLAVSRWLVATEDRRDDDPPS